MKTKINLLYNGENNVIDVDEGINLLTLIQNANLPLNTPCGGKGLCGKCKIKVIDGNLEANSSDIKFFNKEEIQEGYRLACTHTVNSELTIEIPYFCNNLEICTIFENEIEVSTRLQRYELELDNEKLSNYKSCLTYLKDSIDSDLSINQAGLMALGEIIDDTIDETITANVYVMDNQIINISRKEEKIYGVAVDIGTTTIAFALIDLFSGEVVDTYSSINLQNKYGHDVISRIDFASKDEKNKKIMSHTVRQVIEEGIENQIKKHGLKNIYLVGLSGNTTMIQLLLELSSKALSMSPFLMLTNEVLEYQYKEIFSKLKLNCKVLIIPSISAYVGGDITSGILVTDMINAPTINLLIDIGTNGEMVIGSKEGLLCTATAAGPAFEGATLKYGMGAIDGAISSYEKINSELHITTIGSKEPIGICGTGIIDIVSLLVKAGAIDNSGLLIRDGLNEENEYNIAKTKHNCVTITQQDVREIQLAKSAIRSGIEVLINRYGCRYKDINKVYIAGGFGNKISLESAVGIGLLPKALEHKAEAIGNASLAGCIHSLVNRNVNTTFEKIVSISNVIELSMDVEFNQLFMKHMFFEK